MAVDRWFRFYEAAITHDKVRGLPSDSLRWQWVILLAVASKYGGVIPSLKVAAINLNVKEPKAAQIVAALHRAELLDQVEGGYFKPHDWHDRQPVDATAAERKRRQRQKERDNRDSHAVTTVTVTPSEIRDKSKDKKDSEANASAPPARPAEPEFEIEVVGEEPKAKLYRVGKTLLASFGVAEKRTGQLIGMWLKTRPDPTGLLAAMQFARDQNVAEPVAYISALVNGKEKSDGSNRKKGLGDRARELAQQARELERAAGIGRPSAVV